MSLMGTGIFIKIMIDVIIPIFSSLDRSKRQGRETYGLRLLNIARFVSHGSVGKESKKEEEAK